MGTTPLQKCMCMYKINDVKVQLQLYTGSDITIIVIKTVKKIGKLY